MCKYLALIIKFKFIYLFEKNYLTNKPFGKMNLTILMINDLVIIKNYQYLGR